MKTAVFFGSKASGLKIFKAAKEAAPDLDWTVVCPRDDRDPRNAQGDFARFVLQFNKQVLFTDDIDKIQHPHGKPHIALVCNWYKKIPPDFAARGVFGVHHSLLPEYRGSAPLVWAMIHGRTLVGSTLFQMTDEMDAGPIATQVRHTISPHDTIKEVGDALIEKMTGEIRRVWPDIVEGNYHLEPQRVDGYQCWCAPRTPDDGRVDWNLTADKIHDFIRAQADPYPGAFTFWGNERIKLERSYRVSGVWYGTPGQVIRRVNDELVLVACGFGTALEVKGNLKPGWRLS